MTDSPSLSESSDHDEGGRDSKTSAAAPDASARKPRSPPQRKGNRPKSAKAKATTAKSPKKLAPLPPRALNAYNIFFREERKRWIDQRNESETTEQATTSAFPPFAQMGKIIGQRWKELPASEKQKFEILAKEDMQRYRKEIDDYKSKLIQETEKSAETLGKDTVSSAWNYRSSSSDDDLDGDSKPEASIRPQLILPTAGWPADALSYHPNLADATLPQEHYPFATGIPNSSQISAQTPMNSLLNQVAHASHDANMFAYSQQQQLLSMLLPRMALQQAHEQQQLERNQHELLLLQLANSYLPRDDPSVASAFGNNIPAPSLGQLHAGMIPSTNQLLQSHQWQSGLPIPSDLSSQLDAQIRLSALLRQQHLMELIQQQQSGGENTETNSAPQRPER